MLYLTFLLIFLRTSLAEDCLLNATLYYSPLLIRDTHTFAAPSTDNLHHFKSKEFFYVKCPQGSQSPLIPENGNKFVCVGGTNIINSKTQETLNFKTIKCKSELGIVRKTKDRCENNYTLVEIGTQIEDNFVPSVVVCFNEIDIVPFYVEYNTSDYSTCGLCGPSIFKYVDGANLYPVDLDEIYNNYLYMKEIEENLGIENFTAIYRQSLVTSDHFFDVLDAKADYATVIPALISNQALTSCDPFLKNDTQQKHIFGTLGVTTMLNDTGDDVEIYLYKHQIPVPRWIWCVVYDRSYDTDGFFYFQIINREINASEEWSQQICRDGDFYHFNGTCSFGNIIHPLLQKVVDNKWPAVKNKK